MIFRRSKMGAITMDPHLTHHHLHHRLPAPAPAPAPAEEIEGLIRITKDGRVERPPIMPLVPCSSSPGVTSKDVYIDKPANLWARVYVPAASSPSPLPLVVYFHGGGFCVGSAAWSCYHTFLSTLAVKAACIVISVNYRLAPESRLPAAYDDGVAALKWVRRLAAADTINRFWLSRADPSRVFLAGDSAGANIAYHVAARSGDAAPLVLIQPFFGGEARTASERHAAQPPGSALTLAASDSYWRLALPQGSSRDHPWCNPLGAGRTVPRATRMMVCVAETDILRDRNVELCNRLAGAGKRVEVVVQRGVGHAFQVLQSSPVAQARTREMLSHISNFISHGH